MNTDDLKKRYAIKWNRETGAFWIGTLEQALSIGLSQFRQRASLATLADKTDERSMEIKNALQWIWIGIADTQEEALNFPDQFRNDAA